MIRKLIVLFPAILLMFPCSSLSREREALLVSIEALEIKGEAPAERAQAISKELRTLIDSDSGIDVVPGEKVATTHSRYLLKGHIYAGGGRHFVGLQLLDTKTGDAVWSDNYDYTNIPTDLMAKDVVFALHAASSDRQRQ